MQLRFGYRVIYDATSYDNAKMEVCVGSNGRNMPKGVSIALIQIRNNMPLYFPNRGREDSVEWTLTANKMYIVKYAWNTIRGNREMVWWWKLVWPKDYIPRCKFIFWLVVKERLSIKDRLMRWGGSR